MKEKQKYLSMWLLSFVILFFNFIIFMLCFYYERELKLYIICTIVFAAFCFCFSYSNKRIMCEDGYNLMQAYLFFRRCKKNGIHRTPDKFTDEQVEFIGKLASEYDYSKNLDFKKLKKLYKTGYDVDRLFEKKKNKR